MTTGHICCLGTYTDNLLFTLRGDIDGYPTEGSTTSGIIYGIPDDYYTISNRASTGGRAVYCYRPIEVRESTAGESVSLDSTKTGAAGGWE